MIETAVLMVSSKILAGEADSCRDLLPAILTKHQLALVLYEVLPDDREVIAGRLNELCGTVAPPVILTLGGTGVRPTDWVPEATREVIAKEIPGIGEAMRAESLKKVRTAMLSRGTAGIKGRTLIVNLPGSPNGVKENLEVLAPLLEHLVQKISGKSATSKEKRQEM